MATVDCVTLGKVGDGFAGWNGSSREVPLTDLLRKIGPFAFPGTTVDKPVGFNASRRKNHAVRSRFR